MAKTYFIPYNVSDGQISLFDSMVKKRNLFERIIIAVIPFFLLFNLLPFSFVPKLAVSFLFSGFFGVIGLVGVNGDPLSAYISNWFRFLKNKRVAYYNPRIKNEAIPALMQKSEENLSPIDKIRLTQAKKKAEKKASKTASENSIAVQTENGLMFFEDDRGYVDTPEEFKTSAERKADKKLAKQARKRKKNSKRIIIVSPDGDLKE